MRIVVHIGAEMRNAKGARTLLAPGEYELEEVVAMALMANGDAYPATAGDASVLQERQDPHGHFASTSDGSDLSQLEERRQDGGVEDSIDDAFAETFEERPGGAPEKAED